MALDLDESIRTVTYRATSTADGRGQSGKILSQAGMSLVVQCDPISQPCPPTLEFIAAYFISDKVRAIQSCSCPSANACHHSCSPGSVTVQGHLIPARIWSTGSAIMSSREIQPETYSAIGNNGIATSSVFIDTVSDLTTIIGDLKTQ